MKNVKVTTQKFTLKKGCKTAYQLNETKTELIDLKTVNLIEDSCSWYRRLGGSETLTKGYTPYGFNLVKLISKSPCRKKKTIRIFEYLYN
jgi:hypothetical protein